MADGIYKLDKNIMFKKQDSPALVGKSESPKQSDMPMPFGKHKGTLICDLPDGYLLWLLDQDFVLKNKVLSDQLKIENKYRNRWKR